jgi:hypothetical protein
MLKRSLEWRGSVVELVPVVDEGLGNSSYVGRVLVHCGHGERAVSAASLLERAGHRLEVEA